MLKATRLNQFDSRGVLVRLHKINSLSISSFVYIHMYMGQVSYIIVIL